MCELASLCCSLAITLCVCHARAGGRAAAAAWGVACGAATPVQLSIARGAIILAHTCRPFPTTTALRYRMYIRVRVRVEIMGSILIRTD
eukprot:COSAG01_NODE_2628_length_7351_cov_3.274645_5_plen_89_part_00